MKFVITCDKYARRETRFKRKAAADALYKMGREVIAADGALDTSRGHHMAIALVNACHEIDCGSATPFVPAGWARSFMMADDPTRGVVRVERVS